MLCTFIIDRLVVCACFITPFYAHNNWPPQANVYEKIVDEEIIFNGPLQSVCFKVLC